MSFYYLERRRDEAADRYEREGCEGCGKPVDIEGYCTKCVEMADEAEILHCADHMPGAVGL